MHLSIGPMKKRFFTESQNPVPPSIFLSIIVSITTIIVTVGLSSGAGSSGTSFAQSEIRIFLPFSSGDQDPGIDDFVADLGIAADLAPEERIGMYSAPPPRIINTDKLYYATFETARGNIKFQLFADRAPTTVNNFVYLALDGYYNKTTFHRVINQFMAQGGDSTGTGAGGPGYEFDDEFVSGLTFDRPGLLAMANRGPDTNGSQFFLTFVPTPHLNNRHTIFGEIVEGSEILDTITHRDPGTATTPGDEIVTITIEEITPVRQR